jgi:phosphoribosylglycinamide formyltransferase 1
MNVPRIAIFASGGGSNARNLIARFRETRKAEVVLLVCNKQGAGAFQVAAEAHVPSMLIDRQAQATADSSLAAALDSANVEWIILAGYLWKIPDWLVQRFGQHIINIHPALLPAYGGKGMYGHHVHEAVHAAREKWTGITIHRVNEHYDEGAILFQASVAIEPDDSPADIERKVRALEQEHFPRVAEQLITAEQW